MDLNKSECPLKEECPKQNKNSISSEEDILQIMTIGGGPNANAPKKSFEDLISKTFSNKSKIVKVIVTDPFILANSEDGNGNSLDNIKSFLSIIINDKDKKFTLCIQARKKKTESAYNSFCNSLKKEYTNLIIDPINSKFKFHDRFYICKYEDGTYKGVFGPSINGLDSNSIVLFGEIEQGKSLDKIKKWFE
jgi:hypothetical protein